MVRMKDDRTLLLNLPRLVRGSPVRVHVRTETQIVTPIVRASAIFDQGVAMEIDTRAIILPEQFWHVVATVYCAMLLSLVTWHYLSKSMKDIAARVT